MEAPALPSAANDTTPQARPFLTRLRLFAAEPFVHFALLGAMVFAGHRLVAGAESVPAIDVTAGKQRELSRLFEQRMRRPPTDAERQQIIQRHVEDEALYRQGLRLSLVETDPMLRAQLITRVRGILQADVEKAPGTKGDKERTSRAFQAEVDRLVASFPVHVEKQP